MKTLLFVFASILLLQSVSARALDAPQTCDDILSKDTCDKLRNLAQIFHEKATDVNEAVREAVAKHLTKSQEIISFVKQYLVEKANNFKCEDVLSADQCKQLVDFAAKFKVSATDLIEDIKEAVADGAVKGAALYQKTKEILLLKLKNLSCDELISTETCDKLRNIAQIFHEKASDVNEAVREAVAKHLTKSQEIISFVKQYLVEKANNFKCEDVLSADQCKQLVDFAAKFKVSAKDMIEDLKEAIADGVVKGTSLIQKTREILLYKLKNLSCDELMDSETCQKLKDFAAKTKASAAELKSAMIDAYSKGLEKSKDFLAEAKRYLTEELSCDAILSADSCEKIRAFLANTRISFDQVMQKLKEAYANGKDNAIELAKVAWQYIKDNIWPFGYENISEDQMIELMDMLEKY